MLLPLPLLLPVSGLPCDEEDVEVLMVWLVDGCGMESVILAEFLAGNNCDGDVDVVVNVDAVGLEVGDFMTSG